MSSVKSLFGFGGGTSTVQWSFQFNDSTDETSSKRRATVIDDNLTRKKKSMILSTHTSLTGTMTAKLDKRPVDYTSFTIEWIGELELTSDKVMTHSLLHHTQVIASEPGTLVDGQTFAFDFSHEHPPRYESYQGTQVDLRYFFRLVLTRSYTSSNLVSVHPIEFQTLVTPPESSKTIKMEVGIEDCLHLEFEYDRSHFHLTDVVQGRVFFLLVRIKLKYMELTIVRQETLLSPPEGNGNGSNSGEQEAARTESTTLTKFELCDGAPVKGDVIPVRFFLSELKLSPTYDKVASRFSTTYYLNLVLVDQDDRRYFKKQQVVFYRAALG